MTTAAPIMTEYSVEAALTLLATDLLAVTQASWCAWLLRDVQGRGKPLVVPERPKRSAADRQTCQRQLALAIQTGEEVCFPIGGSQALVFPLSTDGACIGAVLLAFEAESVPACEAIRPFIQLASRSAKFVRQIETIQSQTNDLVEGMRLREIQVSRNLIRGVIDSVPIGLALVEADGSIRAANRALAERFGREPVGLVGLSYASALGAWDDAPAHQTFATGQPQRLRRQMALPGRGQVLLEIASFPIGEIGSWPTQVVEVWEDITERVSLQTQLVRAEKLAAIGQLAASIAHEVGNPLQAIQGFLALFLEQCEPETPNQHFLQLAEEEIERIVQVLARLRDLYRPRADVMAPTDLNDLVEGILLLTGKQLERRRIRVLKELDLTLPDIDLVADQIKQVLLNLVLNAADAMNDGGLLHIQTYMQSDRSNHRMVILTVTDTGVGITPDQLPFIFDGLHTTKERGMGLGLYTSKAIIERHMGRISAQSHVDQGTTFVISLPIKDATETA